MRKVLATAALVTIAALGSAGTAHACTPLQPGQTRVRAVFDASTDTVKPVNDTHPVGRAVINQTGTGSITGKVKVSGLLPNRAYLVVPYKDPYCAPTPSVTAFPSSAVTTDGSGNLRATFTVNPQAVSPAGQFTLDQTKSVSIREVAVASQNPGGGLPGTPNVPLVITEACQGNPTVRTG